MTLITKLTKSVKGALGLRKDDVEAVRTKLNTLIDTFNYNIPNSVFVGTPTAVAINATATALGSDIVGGLITSTSAAAVALTLPTATNLAAALTNLGITVQQGTYFDFIVDNSAGANTITVTVNTGIAVATPAVTGGATLTVSTTNVYGVFRIYFTSATTAKISRII